MPVPPDYAARETAKIDPDDSCGPEFLQDVLPRWLVASTTPLFDGPFRPVCERHDACYGLEEHSQAWCDDRFHDEMTAICDTGRSGGLYSAPLIGAALCRRQANAYFAMVNNSFGAYAYGDGDKVYPPGGRIVAQDVRIIPHAGGERVEVCVDILNDTMILQEYDVALVAADGRLIDREPDLYDSNVRAGASRRFCFGADRKTLESGDLRIILRADRPDSFMFNDVMEMVDEAAVSIRIPNESNEIAQALPRHAELPAAQNSSRRIPNESWDPDEE